MQRNVLSLVGVFLAGILLGWLAIGWWLWPVAYVGDAYTYELNQADKTRYVSAVVDSFAATGLADPAWFSGWYADEIQQALEQVAQVSPAKANWARALGEQTGASLDVRVAIQPTPVPLTVRLENQAKGSIPQEDIPWAVVIAGMVLLAIVGGGAWLVRDLRKTVWRKPGESFTQAFPTQVQPTPRYTDLQSSQYVPLHPPSDSLTRASLTFGPDQPCDQHLPIERDGQHLGEFGVSQVEGEQAWDVWLFDQKALVTVTKVLADQASEGLAGRGEVIALDSPIALDTPGLRMTGRAMQFGEGVKVELTVEGKETE